MIVDLKQLGKFGKSGSPAKGMQAPGRRKRVVLLVSMSFVAVAVFYMAYIRVGSESGRDVNPASSGLRSSDHGLRMTSNSHRDTVLLTVRSDFADLDPLDERPDPVNLVRLQPAEIQSILDDILPRAISLLQPEYVVITSDDLERRMAGTGFLRKDYRSRDIGFMLDTTRSKVAVFVYVFRKIPDSKNTQYKLVTDIAEYSDHWIGRIESGCEGPRNELVSCVEDEITKYLRALTTREFVAAVLSVADDKIVFSFKNRNFIRSGALLTLRRKYDSTKSGLQKRLRDLRNEIDYLKKHGGADKRIANLEMQYGETNQELARAKDTPGPVSTMGWFFGTVKVMEVFDTTAIGVVLENNEPWLIPSSGDELMLADHK